MEFGSVPLQVGDQVRVGELVGTVGDTGFAFGPHLHFEIRLGGTEQRRPRGLAPLPRQLSVSVPAPMCPEFRAPDAPFVHMSRR